MSLINCITRLNNSIIGLEYVVDNNGYFDKIMFVNCLLKSNDHTQFSVNKYLEHYRIYLINVFRIAKSKADKLYKNIAVEFGKTEMEHVEELLQVIRLVILKELGQRDSFLLEMKFTLVSFGYKQHMDFQYELIEKEPEIIQKQTTCYLTSKITV